MRVCEREDGGIEVTEIVNVRLAPRRGWKQKMILGNRCSADRSSAAAIGRSFLHFRLSAAAAENSRTENDDRSDITPFHRENKIFNKSKQMQVR